MKVKIGVLIGVLLLLSFALPEGAVFAQEAAWQTTEAELKEHTWEIGTEISYITYEEPDFMKESGMMYGVVGSYAYHDKFMLKAEGKGSWGVVDYGGKLLGGRSYQINSVNDCMMEFRGMVGYDFLFSRSTFLTPYIGCGYRYLSDDSSSDPAGYRRESNYFYSPMGIETFTQFEDGWSLGGIVEFDAFWFGIQRSYLKSVWGGVVNNDQKSGWGMRGSIRIQKVWKDFGVVVEPFLRYWNIKKSKETIYTQYSGSMYSGYEPKNNSMEIGGKLALVF